MPARPSSQFDIPLSTAIGPAITQAKPISGAAFQLATISGCTSATAFGTSSPKVMCSIVMMMNAMMEATVCVATALKVGGRAAKAPRIRCATAGSPTQPSPSEVRVMPSWVAEMYRASD